MVCTLCVRVLITLLSCQIVVAIPWEVQISMCELSVYPYSEGSICFWCYNGIQKGMEPSSLDSSTVNWMEGSTVLIFLRNSSLCE